MKKRRIPIDKREAYLLFETVGDWNKVATYLGVSTTTLRRRRIEWEKEEEENQCLNGSLSAFGF